MIFRRFLTIAAVAAWAVAASAAPKVPAADEALLKAYDAFRAGDALKLQRFASQVGSAHVLAPYLEYWRLKLRIEDAPDAEVQRFPRARVRAPMSPSACARDWLKELGKRGDWSGSSSELPLLAQDDLEIRCYGWLARLARARRWRLCRSARDVARAARVARGLRDARRQDGRSAAHQRRRRLARACACCSRTASSAPRAARSATCRRAKSTTRRCSTRRRPRRRICSPARRRAWSGARRARWCCSPWCASARSEPEAAVEVLQGKLGERLPAADVKYLWGRLAFEGARRLIPEAHGWYALRRRRDAERRATGLEGARRAARGGLAGGARRDRPHVGDRAPGSGLDLLVRPRARRAGERRRRARLFPAHLGPAEFLRPARRRGARRHGGRARALPRAERGRGGRGARRSPGSRARSSSTAWSCAPRRRASGCFTIRGMDDARAAGGRRARAPRRRSSTARSTPPTAPRSSTTTRCASSRRSRRCSTRRRAAPAWRKPGCSAWCARRAASSSTPSPRPARAA